MTGVAPSQLPPEIANALAEIQQARFQNFSRESLAWLALPPAWTEELAVDCRFPVDKLEGFLADAVRAKLCSRDPEALPGEPTSEAARTLGALWRYLKQVHRAEYHQMFNNYARGIPDREEGLALLISAVSDEGAEFDFALFYPDIESVPDPEARARIMVHGALHFPQQSHLESAWHATAWLASPQKRLTARAMLCEKAAQRNITLPTGDLLAEARSLSDPAFRAGLLLKLDELGIGGGSLRSEAGAAIEQIQDLAPQALYFSLLARASGNRDYADRALRAALSLPDTAMRSRVISTIALNCSDAVQTEALNLAWSFALNVQDTGERTALLALADSQWARVQPEAALAHARELSPAECRAEVMMACLSEPKLRTAAVADEIARQIEDIPLENIRIRLQLRLASYVPTGSLRPLESARKLQDDAERRAALLSLLPSLSGREGAGVASEILNDLRRVGDPQTVRSALVQLAPYLDDQQMWEALGIAVESKAERGFRVDEAARAEIIDFLLKDRGGLFLYENAYAAGQAIQNVKKTGVPAATVRWAKLASLLRDSGATVFQKVASRISEPAQSSRAGSCLTKQVREFVDAGDTGSALSWLSAGQLLVPVAGGDVEAAVITGKHRVELSYRRSMDERHLRRYLERTEQTVAFQGLLNGPDTHWALHFLGVGGVGKTMLLRHVTARLAVKDGRRLATSRVDFDHISPEFPVRKPGQLLAELADELRIYGGSSSIEGKFVEFQDRLLELHSKLSVQPPPDDPLKNINSDAFKEVIASFADLVRLLPPPVILILDTCEELSKLEPVSSTLPSIDATFLILQKLHELIPSVRVVLAGRRLLAQSGDSATDRPARWRAAESELGERNRYLPEHKDYLRLHVIRGFTREECGRFLDQIADVHPDEARRAAILERSVELSKPVDIEWSEDRAEDAGPRWNPFDLALYAEWLRESDVSAETIRSGSTEPYVEMRIVRRMEKERSRKALPAAVLLRRFDSEMLRAIEPDPSLRAGLFRDLQGHEWTDSQRDEDSSVSFLEVNTNLRKRIESYFSSTQPRSMEMEGVREALGADLDLQVRVHLEKPQWFNLLNFSRVEPALRLQPDYAAALLWDAIDRRITESAEWNWALRICQQLLGEGNVAGDLDSPLRAAIRATLNATLLHLQRDFRPEASWLEVAQCADSHPIPEIGRWLAYRAATFAATDMQALRALAIQLGELSEWGRYRHEQAAAGLFARVYESGARIEDPDNWPQFGPESSPELTPLRLLALSRAPIYELDLPQPLQRWADWRIPDCLTDRVRLEIVLTVLSVADARRYALPWGTTAAARLDNMDSERLLSALLALRHLDDAPAEMLVQITAARYYDPNRKETCPAHSATKPLYYQLALEWKRRGETARAIEIVSQVRAEMLDNRESDVLLPELARLVAVEPPESTPAPPAVEPESGARDRYLPLLGLAVIAVSIYGLYRLVLWSMASEQHLQYTGIGVGIIACIVLAPLYRNLMLQSIAMAMRPKLLLRDAGERVHVTQTQGGVVRPALGILAFRSVYDIDVARPGSGPYREEGRRLEELASRLRTFRHKLLGGRMPFELIIPSSLQSIAWEAILHAGIAGPTGKIRELLQFARTAPPLAADAETVWQTGGGVLLLARSGQMATLERAWSAKSSLSIQRLDERAASTVPGIELSGPSKRAMHLVGRTRRSGGGERAFQITPERYFTVSQILAVRPQIVIVHCQPVESLFRTDTDREQIAALRGFAADLFDAGVHTVIFLPQMPVAASDAAVLKVAAFCAKKRRPGYLSILSHVSALRNTIVKSINADSASLAEATQRYTSSESAAPAESATVDLETLNIAREEMSMDVTVWTRLA